MDNQKRIRTKGWFLTYPQCDRPKEELKAFLETMGMTRCVIACEKHASGDSHLHCWVSLKSKKQFSSTLFDFKDAAGNCHHGNYQPARNHLAVIKYISKDGDFIHCNMPQNFLKKHTAKEILTTDPAQLVEDNVIHPLKFKLLLENQYLYAIMFGDKYDHTGVRGTWIYGPPRLGKSYYARDYLTKTYGSYYVKTQDKWFQGYNSEEAILLDDLDTDCLGHYLKIWLDRYHCKGEVKGSYVQLRHKEFIITSNYTPEELWSGSKVKDVMAQAIRARCRFIRFDMYQIPVFE